MLKNIVAIAIGAAFGTLLRYSLNVYTLFVGYPIGTIIENVSGSLLLGFLTGWFLCRSSKEWIKVGLGVGFCGGFTTMSTLAADFVYITSSGLLASFLYLTISFLGGILFGLVGLMCGMKLGEKTQKPKEGELS
ncbi:fluoride efflux transporter FluC [Bacillus alkalicellulosilyticus]|uniref:fluoride efflux transporter FluC n=1 Tax=Alkalihalobacterium alkalicellulosilyticum TaxID=1912214 RepID=UPI000998E57C|nr:CrcB family protein [Bacillus alkalicellulosilyticus]